MLVEEKIVKVLEEEKVMKVMEEHATEHGNVKTLKFSSFHMSSKVAWQIVRAYFSFKFIIHPHQHIIKKIKINGESKKKKV